MVRCRQRGYSLIEILVSLAVFGIIIAIFSILAAELRSRQKRYPVNFMRNPQISAALSRLRRDVHDAYGPEPYLNSWQGYEMGKKVLIVQAVQPTRGREQVVWDFREPGVVRRRSYNVGVPTDWVVHGLPQDFDVEIKAVKFRGRPYGVRVIARDDKGRVSIDQILQPRADE